MAEKKQNQQTIENVERCLVCLKESDKVMNGVCPDCDASFEVLDQHEQHRTTYEIGFGGQIYFVIEERNYDAPNYYEVFESDGVTTVSDELKALVLRKIEKV